MRLRLSMNLSPDKPLSIDDLPFTFKFPNVPELTIRAEMLKYSHLPKIETVWQKAHEKGNGIANEEDFEYMRSLLRVNEPFYFCFVLLNNLNDDLIAMIVTYPCKMSRSVRPPCCCSFIIVNEAYRGKKIALNIMVYFKNFIESTGYFAILGRACVIARSIVPSVKAGYLFYGLIPWCSYMEGRGWFHDMIVYEKFKDVELDIGFDYIFPTLDDRGMLEASLPMFKKPFESHKLPRIHHKLLGDLTVEFATTDGIWKAQEILREIALEGHGLGLDEFTTDGVYSEKLILNCKYWLVKTETDGQIAAIILSGENGHGRSYNKHMANGFIIVLKPFRKLGLATQLLHYSEEQCLTFGYKYILTDLLASNIPGLAIMRKSGYHITGTLPLSCIVQDKAGFTDCYLFWKQLPIAKV